MTSHVTTHVLDAAQGRPASGVSVRLEAAEDSLAGSSIGTEDSLAGSSIGTTEWTSLAEAVTDADGRVKELGPEQLEAGDYRLTFGTGDYFDRLGIESFYPQVQITFRITDPAQHYHVPVLLSPFAYSTYRGS
ncbi:hydroxyisourate hydrolase [Saccharopolyspora taberi]|uniref:5-hydroxyisourate hydrolase n=1 Tax=Saccharopolyspora taberi TaxID=60895 RepID=A0ABN3VLJ6_9PSEU